METLKELAAVLEYCRTEFPSKRAAKRAPAVPDVDPFAEFEPEAVARWRAEREGGTEGGA